MRPNNHELMRELKSIVNELESIKRTNAEKESEFQILDDKYKKLKTRLKEAKSKNKELKEYTINTREVFVKEFEQLKTTVQEKFLRYHDSIKTRDMEIENHILENKKLKLKCEHLETIINRNEIQKNNSKNESVQNIDNEGEWEIKSKSKSNNSANGLNMEFKKLEDMLTDLNRLTIEGSDDDDN